MKIKKAPEGALTNHKEATCLNIEINSLYRIADCATILRCSKRVIVRLCNSGKLKRQSNSVTKKSFHLFLDSIEEGLLNA